MAAKVLILGSNFGGMVAALSVHQELHGNVEVTVISPSDRFLFTPSLIWVPFGKRSVREISVPVAPTFESHGVNFVNAAATQIDPVRRIVATDDGHTHRYDYLVIATGYLNDFDAVPGIGPGGNASTITTADDAVDAAAAWRRYLVDPGDVVVGATPGAGCFGAAYEFLFNTAHQLKQVGLHTRVKLSYVTPEPFLGHFGIGDLPGGERLLRMFMTHSGIEAITGAAIAEVEPDSIRLSDGRHVPFSWAMVVPAFRGQTVVTTAHGLADDKGFIPVRDTYQSEKYDDIYAVGVAAAVAAPWITAIPVGVPKTGFPTERQAHVAARNIAAQIRGDAPSRHKAFAKIPALCVMDAGNNGVLILADHMLPHVTAA